MESFKSKQFGQVALNQDNPPVKLKGSVRKMYPELASILDLEVKQEKLLKLQKENGKL
jgi:hypothetical protein